MHNFTNLTPTNGFDKDNLLNARQNNYAWSMSELGDYIYVGVGRNILVTIINTINPNINLPISIDPIDENDQAEIWRYKKDESQSWELVFKAPDVGIYGFRYMITYDPFDGNPALYAAGASLLDQIIVYKSTNGVDWKKVLEDVKPSGVLQGTSSRAMVVKNDKLYLSTIDETGLMSDALLYSSEDPEFYKWELETPPSTTPGYDTTKNPQGNITNMEVFNNKIYVATSTDTGIQVWRTDGEKPMFNKWTLIVDNGFGNPDNKYSLAIGTFKDYIYVSGTKELPLAWALPRGCDIIRIDKHDNWEMVVGGPLTYPPQSLSGLYSGFNNPFNVYAWQIKEYKNKLFITTFDDATNMQVILELILANKAAIEELIGPEITKLLIYAYKTVVKLLNNLCYPFGFDLYVSHDGKHFRPVFLNGLGNRYNYGGRMLYVDCENDLYLGTANPFEGLEVYKYDNCDCDHYSCDGDKKLHAMFSKYEIINEEIRKSFEPLEEYQDTITPIITSLLQGRKLR